VPAVRSDHHVSARDAGPAGQSVRPSDAGSSDAAHGRPTRGACSFEPTGPCTTSRDGTRPIVPTIARWRDVRSHLAACWHCGAPAGCASGHGSAAAHAAGPAHRHAAVSPAQWQRAAETHVVHATARQAGRDDPGHLHGRAGAGGGVVVLPRPIARHVAELHVQGRRDPTWERTDAHAATHAWTCACHQGRR
jgi:hypothetical protein